MSAMTVAEQKQQRVGLLLARLSLGKKAGEIARELVEDYSPSRNCRAAYTTIAVLIRELKRKEMIAPLVGGGFRVLAPYEQYGAFFSYTPGYPEGEGSLWEETRGRGEDEGEDVALDPSGWPVELDKEPAPVVIKEKLEEAPYEPWTKEMLLVWLTGMIGVEGIELAVQLRQDVILRAVEYVKSLPGGVR